MINFETKLNEYVSYFNASLDNYLSTLKCDSNLLIDSIKYAITDGGKRIRPVLCFATAEMLGGEKEDVLSIALAVEMIHSYSLVHDDLPAMDNDDYRRGKLSTHKKFGEANGILTGDALLNLAFEVAISNQINNENYLKALNYLFKSSGYSGMICGQVLDLQNEKSGDISQEELYKIYLNKTAKLIMAPIVSSTILFNDKYVNKLEQFGENLGYLFQITDDVLDVESTREVLGKSIGKDMDSDKLTSVKIFGLDGAKIKAKTFYENCINCLNGIDNNEFLCQLTEKIYKRNK